MNTKEIITETEMEIGTFHIGKGVKISSSDADPGFITMEIPSPYNRPNGEVKCTTTHRFEARLYKTDIETFMDEVEENNKKAKKGK